MKKSWRYILITVIAIFVVIQFVPVNRDNQPVDEAMVIQAPPEVLVTLETSCYDCHSHKTNWPFYAYIAPVSWLVAGDVEEGRENLNFSEWYKMPEDKRAHAKGEIIDEVTEGEMPLPIYLITHSDAELNDRQKQILRDWAGGGESHE